MSESAKPTSSEIRPGSRREGDGAEVGCSLPILATYSPCCGMLRKGHQRPDIMHTGLCRRNHEGNLGPTVYLVDAREVEQLRNDLTVREGEADQLNDHCADLSKQHHDSLDERDRLRTGLLSHACFCGSSDPDPTVHREDCGYRKWASPASQLAPTNKL